MNSCCSAKGCNTQHAHSHHAHEQAANPGHATQATKTCTPSEDPSGGGCCSSADDDPESESLTSHHTYSWHIAGLDCPACVTKAVNALNRLPNVAKASISFSTLRLQVQFHPGQMDKALIQSTIEKLGFSLAELDEELPEDAEPSFLKKHASIMVLALLLGGGALLKNFHPEAGTASLILATLWGLLPITRKAVTQIQNGTPFGIETLMAVAAIGALLLGETFEAGMVLLLFLIGEELEGLAASRARSGVKSLMALRPDKAVRIISNGSEDTRETITASKLVPGDLIEVLPGDRLPADGELISAQASFDESALTGESVPVDHSAGDRIMAGAMAAEKVTRLKVISEPGANAIDRIIQLIEDAEERKAPVERFIDRFSRWYTPLMMVISALVVTIPPLLLGGEWAVWVYRGLAVLLVACPCALVISTPAAVTSGLARASRQGILIKGGAALERLAQVRHIALDKTGTLTEGKPKVVDVIPFEGEASDLLKLAAAVEQGSSHPLAQAVVRKAKQTGVVYPDAGNISAQAGKGVSGLVEGRTVIIGSPKHQADRIARHVSATETILTLEQQGCTVIAVSADQRLLGLLAIRDTLRTDAIEALARLRSLSVESIMLTGDNQRAAAAIAGQLGIDFRAELLPENKVEAIEELQRAAPVAMVGDGINDAPALKRAHVGIAMGKGTDVALETADAALTHERVRDLATAIDLSRATLNIVKQNVIFAVGLKAVFLVTSLFGMTGLLLAVMADTGATALVTLNSLRLLKRKNKF